MDPSALLTPRLVVGVVGLLLLLGGVGGYRRALSLGGFSVGAVVAVDAAQRASITGPPVWIAVLFLGALGALAVTLGEFIAVRLVGAAAFALLGSLLAPFLVGMMPAWIVVAGSAILGLFLMPPLYRSALPLVTAAGGALLVAWSLDRFRDPVVLSVALIVGLLVPWVRSRKKPAED